MKNKLEILIGGLVSLTAGCSALLEGASLYAKTKDAYILTKTAAEATRVYEADERAKNTASRGLEKAVNAIEEQNRYMVENIKNDNPLLWDMDYVSSDGDYVVFAKRLNNDISRSYEIFLMKKDGSGLRRITFNKELDIYPRIKGDIIGWGSISDDYYSIHILNLTTGKETVKITPERFLTQGLVDKEIGLLDK